MADENVPPIRDNLRFEHGETRGDYQIIDKDGYERLDDPRARPIGCGRAGVTYRAKFRKTLDRAIKFLCPDDKILRFVDWARFQESFKAEIQILATVTHTRIVKIVDFAAWDMGRPEDGGAGLVQWVAMEYVDGQQLGEELLASPECTGQVFVDLFDQILAALQYLHLQHPEQQIMHMDIKGDNILVRTRLPWSATLVDLGVAKAMGPVLPDDDGTYFFSTPSNVHPKWLNQLDRKIPRAMLRTMFPHHDLYAVGRLLEDALSPITIERLDGYLGKSGVQALLSIKDRLLALEYDSVSQVRLDWSKLRPEYLAPLGVPEMSLAASRSVTTPMGRVGLTDRMHEIIDHPLVQRMRLASRLEFSYLVNPGARHSRLLHSLTAFDLARQYLSHLLNDSTFRLMVEPDDIVAALLWALLHDIGRYPLSLMFEDIQTTPPHTFPSHKDLFWAFVDPQVLAGDQAMAPYATLISEALKRSSMKAGMPSIPLWEALIQPNRFLPQHIATLQKMKDKRVREASHRVLSGVITSAIGVDRAAYLLDDSRMSGVRYGLGIDLDALLSALQAPHADDIAKGDGPMLAISDKGLPAAESLVLARYWMLRRVYWHHTNRAIMAMAKFVIGTLLHANVLDFGKFFQTILFQTEVEATRHLAGMFDTALRVDGTTLPDRPMRNPLRGLLDGNRFLYKRLMSVMRGPRPDDRLLYDRLVSKTWEDLARLTEGITDNLQKVLAPAQPIRLGDIILDVPVATRDEYGPGTVLIYFRSDPASAINLYDPRGSASPILQNLDKGFDLHVKKCRVFIHPSLQPLVQERGQALVSNSVLDTIRDSCGV